MPHNCGYQSIFHSLMDDIIFLLSKYEDVQKPPSKGLLSSSKAVCHKAEVCHTFLPFHFQIHFHSSCALSISQGEVSFKLHFESILVHGHPCPLVSLTTVLDCICLIWDMAQIDRVGGLKKPLLISPCASGKSM